MNGQKAKAIRTLKDLMSGVQRPELYRSQLIGALAFVDLVSGDLTQAAGDTRRLAHLTSERFFEDLVEQSPVVFELDLTSPALNELGLAAAPSEWLAQQVGERHGLQTVFKDDAGDVPLTEDARALLFRNARELLMNVLKHAQARKVTVAMTCRENALRVRIQDDGVGFDPLTLTQQPGKPGAFGLFSIRERIADVGGSLKIVSKPGEGTTATLIAPLYRLG